MLAGGLALYMVLTYLGYTFLTLAIRVVQCALGVSGVYYTLVASKQKAAPVQFRPPSCRGNACRS